MSHEIDFLTTYFPWGTGLVFFVGVLVGMAVILITQVAKETL